MEPTTVAGPVAVYQSLPVDQIRPSPHQARKLFDDEAIKSLAQSMKEEGLLQPITVRRVEEGTRGRGDETAVSSSLPLSHSSSPKYELIAGERRLRAAKLLGWPTIEAKIIATANEASAAAKGLAENLQREDLNPMEEAEAFQELMQLDPAHWSQVQIAKVAGHNQPYISQSLVLLRLDPEVQVSIRRRILPRSNALELARLPLAQQAETAEKAKDLSQKETRKLVDQMLGSGKSKQPKGAQPARDPDPMAAFWVKLRLSVPNEVAWEVKYPQAQTWSIQITPKEGDWFGSLARWFEAMAASVRANDPLQVAPLTTEEEKDYRKVEIQMKADDDAANKEADAAFQKHLEGLDPKTRAEVEAALKAESSSSQP